jgi:RNA polymerase sigma factor (sigma-70 family)
MRKYDVENYIRFETDLKSVLGNKLYDRDDYENMTRDELITKFIPLVINLSRKFSTTQVACGVLQLPDLIQFGNIGLISAVDRLKQEKLEESDDKNKTIKSFLSKRISGAIRRGIDSNRGSLRIPEHKLNQIRKDSGEDQHLVRMFFNSIFLSIDENPNGDASMVYQIPTPQNDFNPELLNAFLRSLLRKHLNIKEFQVLSLSYGLDNGKKYSAKEIAVKLGIKGSSSYVRVSQLKKQAINRLVENVDHSQVVDFLPNK